MTSRHVSLAAIFVAAAGVAIVMAQRSSQTPAGVSVTGCLRQGSGPAVFILRGAALPPVVPAAAIAPVSPHFEAAEASAETADYLLVSVPSRVDLGAHLNHKVEITGEKSDSGAPPAGANAAERALPRLTVSDARDVAPNCSSASAPAGAR